MMQRPPEEQASTPAATPSSGNSAPAAPETIEVRIGRLGEKPITQTAPIGATVGDVLRMANVDAGSMTVRVGGEDVDLNTHLEDGDQISLRPRVQGGEAD